MTILALIAGIGLLVITLADAFGTMVLARRTSQSLRLTALFYIGTWKLYAAVGRRINSGRERENLLGFYGPFSLLALLGMWAFLLILGFALIQTGVHFQAGGRANGFADNLYASATTLFALSTGQPQNILSRLFSVIEGGLGLTFLGLSISYLPVLYQAYSRREVRVFMLDARGGSPPTISEILKNIPCNKDNLERRLEEWEGWAAELLQNQIAYPMLTFFRSQHPNQSWLGALVAMTDTAAIVQLCTDDDLRAQATLTFAMGRHALADLARIFRVGSTPAADRLPPEDFQELRNKLAAGRRTLNLERLKERELAKLREMYEGHAQALSDLFLISLPGWMPVGQEKKNWSITDAERDSAMWTVSDAFQDEESSN